jgi:hypothetical protein
MQDGGICPSPDLGVAVTKRYAARVDVIAGGAIDPPVIAGNIEKVSVVDAVRILIYEEPDISGTRHREVAGLDVNAIPVARLVSAEGVGGGVDPSVHGHAAAAVCARAAHGINCAIVIGAFVGGTAVNAGTADIRI